MIGYNRHQHGTYGVYVRQDIWESSVSTICRKKNRTTVGGAVTTKKGDCKNCGTEIKNIICIIIKQRNDIVSLYYSTFGRLENWMKKVSWQVNKCLCRV